MGFPAVGTNMCCPPQHDDCSVVLYNHGMSMVNVEAPASVSSEHRVGDLIRTLRSERQLSVRTLAGRSGFSPSFVSQVEHGQASPSIASLERIVQVLGVTLGEFFHRLGGSPMTVVRVNDRAELNSVWSRAKIEALGPAGPGHALEALMITLKPGGRSASQPSAHQSDEFALVVSGEVRLVLESESHDLAPGDSATISAGTLHHWENTNLTETQFLVVSVRAPL